MEGRKTQSSSKETLSDCSHQVEKIKEVGGKPTCDTANEGRSRGGGASTRASVNTGTLHTSMIHNRSRLKVIANQIWYNIDGGWSQIIKRWRRMEEGLEDGVIAGIKEKIRLVL